MVIASRVLTLRNGNDETEIPIRVLAPECEKPGVWGCRYEVDWPEGTHAMTVWGFRFRAGSRPRPENDWRRDLHEQLSQGRQLVLGRARKRLRLPVVPTLRDLLQGDDLKYL